MSDGKKRPSVEPEGETGSALVQLGGASAQSDAAEPETDPSDPGMVNIRDISIQCGQCGTYQTLTAFSRRPEWNVYTYECENDICDPEVTRTRVEVPEHLDAFARRDPGWRGGRVHGGG